MRAKTSFQRMIIFLSCLMKAAEIKAHCAMPNVGQNRILTTETDKQRFPSGDTLEFQCAPGYESSWQQASRSIICNGRQWSKLQLQCRKTSCGRLVEIPNGKYTYTNGTLFGGKATIECEVGYKLIGENIRTCQEGGWDGKDPVCEVVKCPEHPNINKELLDDPHQDENEYRPSTSYDSRVQYRTCIYVDFLETGGNVTFRPRVKEELESILWKFKNNKVVEYESGTTEWYRFKQQGHLNVNTGDLTLTHLKSANWGVYECEILANGKLMVSTYTIAAMDAVSTPKVTCLSDSAETEELTLQCSVDPPGQATFQWSGPDGFTGKGDRIQINKKTNRDSTYSCTAENNASKKTAFIALKDCFSGDGGTQDMNVSCAGRELTDTVLQRQTDTIAAIEKLTNEFNEMKKNLSDMSITLNELIKKTGQA